jgi:SH3-like domain-containing protein
VDRPVLVVEDVKTLVRSEPRADAAVIAEAALGTEVEAIDALPGWTKIRVDDGSEGWVRASAVFDLVR